MEQQASENPEALINVVEPGTHQVGSIPASQFAQASQLGYRQATPDDIQTFEHHQKYGSLPQHILAGVEAAAEGISGGFSTGAETALSKMGVPNLAPQDIQGRREEFPLTHMVAQGAGLASSAAIPGLGEANLIERAGLGLGDAVGLGAETAVKDAVTSATAQATADGLTGEAFKGAIKAAKNSALAPYSFGEQVGSKIVKNAAEFGLVQTGDEISKAFIDPNSIESAIPNIGLAALFGGGVGAALGAVSPLWKSTAGPKVESFLSSIGNKIGAEDGVLATPADSALDRLETPPDPAIRAALSNDPVAQQFFKDLRQSPSGAGVEVAKSLDQFRANRADELGALVNKQPEDLESLRLGNLSEAKIGNQAGTTLGEELAGLESPASKRFEALKEMKANEPVLGDQVITDPTNPYLTKTVPGQTSQLADQLLKLAHDWPNDSDQMKILNHTLKQLPEQETIGDLTRLATRVQENYNPLNPSLNRNIQQIAKAIQESEADATLKALKEKAPELIEEHAGLRAEWTRLNNLKSDLQANLNLKGGNQNKLGAFIKNIQTYAEKDPEAFLKKISKKDDSYFSNLVEQNFPRTSQIVKNYQIDKIFEKAAQKAAPGMSLNPRVVFDSVRDLSPEIRSSLFSPEQLQKLDTIRTTLDALNAVEKDRNWSNTAPTLMRYLKHLPGTALGLATGVLKESPVLGTLVAGLTNTLGRDAPDAMKLAYLKFLGSPRPVSGDGFKSMFDVLSQTLKGQNLVGKVSKNIFKAGAEVLPQALIPDQKKRDQLDKTLQKVQADPNLLFQLGGQSGHYLPDHASAISSLGVRASNYLNGLRPTVPQQTPLDSELKPSAVHQGAYQKALTIAEQPLSVLQDVKDGSLNAQTMQHLQTLYPSLTAQLRQKISQELIEAKSRGETIPYRMRQSLSLFLGQPLDSTMTPHGILSNQATFAPPGTPQLPSPQGQKGHKVALNSFKKLSNLDQTPLQSRMAAKVS